MRSLATVILAFGLAGSGAIAAWAQVREASGGRKVVQRVAPVYPELARRLSLTGVVRIEASIAPSGIVKTTKVLGGNPVLAEAAVHAIRQWKYEPAPAESVELIELRFDSKK